MKKIINWQKEFYKGLDVGNVFSNHDIGLLKIEN